MQPQDAVTYLDDEQRLRLAALLGARTAIAARSGVIGGSTQAPDIWDLIRTASFILTGHDPIEDVDDPAPKDDPYPYASGDALVLGPETVLDVSRTVIAYRGDNYYLPGPANASTLPWSCSRCPKNPRDREQPCPWEGCPWRSLWPGSVPQLDHDDASAYELERSEAEEARQAGVTVHNPAAED